MSESAYMTATAIKHDYPLLFEMAERFDFAERLGGCTDPLLAEIDTALRELWMARENTAADVSSGDA